VGRTIATIEKLKLLNNKKELIAYLVWLQHTKAYDIIIIKHGGSMKKLLNYLKLIRVKHYVKNILIFIPLFFSGQILNINKVITCILGFISFSLIASSVYIINDINDIEKDKVHPEKKYRPLASEAVSKKEAYILLTALLIITTLINIIMLNNNNYYFILLELLYLILNIGYSLGLKKIPILDVVILVSGFVIRVLYGGIITNIMISNWLYLTIMSGSFCMSFGKRRNELIKQSDKSRDVLRKYNREFLDKFMNVSLILLITFYSLWCIDSVTILKFGNEIIWTIPILLIILMKYSLDIDNDSFGDPVEVLFGDKTLIGLTLILIFIMIGMLYL